MGKSMISNQKLTLKSTITTALGTDDTFYVYETGLDVESASVVFKNAVQLERFKLDIDTDGLCTIVLRGLDPSDIKTEDPALKKERGNGTKGYITMLASDFIDADSEGEEKILGDNFIFNGTTEFNGTDNDFKNLEVTENFKASGVSNPQPNFATTGERDAYYTDPQNGDKCTVNGVDYSYNGTTVQREAKGVSTPVPNASEDAAGIVEMATEAEVEAGTDIGGSGANLFVKPSLLKERVTSVDSFVDDSFMLGEPITAGQCAFLETGPSTGEATTKQDIGDSAANTRISFPIIGTGVESDNFNVNICKTGSTHPADQSLYFRIETDNAGSPSGTLVNPNAIAHILPADLTTSLADTTMTFTGGAGTDAHGVTLDSTESSQTVYKGIKFTLTQQTTMISVDKDSDCTATECYLYSTAGVLLATETFVADLATFNYTGLVNGESYYLMVGSDGSSYTSVKQTGAASYPYNSTKLNYIGGAVRNLGLADSFTTGNSSVTSPYNCINTVYFTMTKSCYLGSVGMVGTNAKLYSAGGALLESAVGNTFSGTYLLNSGVSYYITTDATAMRQWNSGTAFPYVLGNLTITSTSNGITAYGNGGALTITTLPYIITDTNINNIVDINYGGTISITKGQKCHLVAFQSTSDDYADTVLDTDYYNIGYNNDVDTTTRPLYTYDGTDWSGGYIQSNGFSDTDIYTPQDGSVISDSQINPSGVSADWETNGIITTNELDYSTLAVSGYANTYKDNSYAGNAGSMIALWRDTDNYVRIRCNNPNTGDETNNVEIKAGGSVIYSTSVVAGFGNETLSYYFKILKSGNDYSFYYRSGSWTQIGVTQTNAFTGNPKFICSGYNFGTGASNYLTNPFISNIDFSGLSPTVNGVFPYISSDLVQDELLSLTDATYAYKVDLKGIAIESKGIGTYPKLTIQGINGEQSGLTPDSVYFLSDTPGLISSTQGTISYGIGTSITDDKIFIGKGRVPGDVFTYSTWSGGNFIGTTYAKIGSATIDKTGYYRITMITLSASDSTDYYARIYKNGIAYGTEHNFNGNVARTLTDELLFQSGDTIEFRGHYGVNTNGGFGVTTIKYTDLPGNTITIT